MKRFLNTCNIYKFFLNNKYFVEKILDSHWIWIRIIYLDPDQCQNEGLDPNAYPLKNPVPLYKTA